MNKNVKLLISPYLGFSKTTWQIILAGFINSTGLTLTLYISLYLNSLHFSISQIGTVITCFGVGGLVGGYLGGHLTQNFTPLKVCRSSLLSSAAFLVLLPLSSALIYLCCLTSLLGITTNLFRPAFILALASGEKAGDLEKIIALRRVAINLGMAFGAAILSSLISKGFIFLFWINSIANFAAYVVIKNIQDVRSTAKSSSPDKHHNMNYVNFYFILILMFSILLIFNQGQIIYPLYLKNEANASLHLLSLLFTINGAMIALLQLPITSKLSKYNPNLVCAFGTLLIGLGFSLISFLKLTTFTIIISCITWTMGEIMFFPAVLAVILRISGNKKGKNVGIYQFVFSLSLLVSPAFGTFIYAYDKNLLWHISAIIGLITCISFLLNTKYANFVPFTLTPQTNREST